MKKLVLLASAAVLAIGLSTAAKAQCGGDETTVLQCKWHYGDFKVIGVNTVGYPANFSVGSNCAVAINSLLQDGWTVLTEPVSSALGKQTYVFNRDCV